MRDHVTKENLELFAAAHYESPCGLSTDEFKHDLAHIKYVKRLFTKYKVKKELRHRLILNHIIILYNMFGSAATKMLFLELSDDLDLLVPFVVKLNRAPEFIFGVGDYDVIKPYEIPVNQEIVDVLDNL